MTLKGHGLLVSSKICPRRMLIFSSINPNEDDELEFSPHFQPTENGDHNEELKQFVSQSPDEILSLAL